MLGLALTFSAMAAPSEPPATASNKKKEKSFNSVSITTVGTVRFRQASKCSMQIYGSKKVAEKIRSRIDNGQLIVDYGSNGVQNIDRSDEVHIEITAPTLKSIEFNGVGEFSCDSTMHIDNNLKVIVNGVGEFIAEDLHCKSLDVEINGVGKSWINVQCQQHLNAEVSGVGVLTLRGHTASLSTDRSGIGLVNKRRLKVGR